MKMNLKNYKNRKKISAKNIKITSKNFLIFLISFTLVALIIGILFYIFMSSTDKSKVGEVVASNFKIKNEYNYLSIFKEDFLSNTYNITLIWFLGISVIGIIIVLFLYFFHVFSIGFTISAIINTYKTKGIIGAILYLVPSKICYSALLFILTFFSLKFSYKVIRLFFFNEQINIKQEMKKYFKVLIVSFILIIGISMLSTFIDPIFIKLFTNL